MVHQLSFADSEFANKRRQTRKEKFLYRMEKLIPWQRFALTNITRVDKVLRT